MQPALDGVVQGGEGFVYAVYALTWLTILGYTAFVLLTRGPR